MQDTIPLGFTKYTFNYPTNSGVIAWQGRLADRVTLRTRIGVLERIQRDPYAIWDFDAAYTRGSVHPFVQLSNITSTSYEEIQGVIMPGRAIMGGIEVVLRRK